MNARTSHASGGRRAVAFALLLLTLGGCATWQAPTDTGDASLRTRAVVQSSHGVEVRAAVLGAEDSLRMLGTDVTAYGVQPIWVEIRNDTADTLWLLRSGSDPDYFSPREVAWSAHSLFGGRANARVDEHFDRLAFPNPILAGKTVSGLLYTNPQPVTRLLNIDLLGNRTMTPFSLLLKVPGEWDRPAVPALAIEADAEVTDLPDLDTLRVALEHLPHCASTHRGTCGEPLNMIFVGTIEDLGAAVTRRGFRRDIRDADQSLQVFGRPPEFVARKRVQANAAATWLRAWRAPISFRGQPVFVVQAGRPVGGRFRADDAEAARLHGDVDEVRNLVIQSFMYSGGLEAVGFLPSVGAVPRLQPRVLEDGTRYFTDGVRAVLFLSTRPRSFADVTFLDWEPFVERVEASAAGQPNDG